MLIRYWVVMWVFFSVFWWSNPSAKPKLNYLLRHISWVWSFHQLERVNHEPGTSHSWVKPKCYFFFLFRVSWPRKSNKPFYINCRNDLTGNMKYVISNYALRSWCGKALVDELMIICFTSYWHLVNSRSWNEMTKLLKQRSDRNNNCTRPGPGCIKPALKCPLK